MVELFGLIAFLGVLILWGQVRTLRRDMDALRASHAAHETEIQDRLDALSAHLADGVASEQPVPSATVGFGSVPESQVSLEALRVSFAELVAQQIRENAIPSQVE